MSEPGGQWKDPSIYRTRPIDPVKGDVPSESDVRKFHTNADTDGSKDALHHSLGPGPSQAAPGNHDHRGGSSTELLRGVTITGSRGTATAITSIISILVDLGAKDSTVA